MKTSRVKGKLKGVKEKFTVTLPGPDELNEPPTDFSSYVALIYGESGVGKTSLLGQFEGSMTLMLEPKRRGIRMRVYEVPYVPIQKMKNGRTSAWEKIKAFVEACKNDDTVRTVCVDNVDRAYELCQNHICFEKNIRHPNDAADYGATWSQVREEFALVFDDLIYDESKALVFSSKFKYDQYEDRNGKKTDRLVPSCSAQCSKYLQECTDFVIYYCKEKNRRAFHLRSDPAVVWTKVGPEGTFMDPDGNPVSCLEAGETPAEAYQTLMDGFANERTDMLAEDKGSEGGKVRIKKKVKRNG